MASKFDLRQSVLRPALAFVGSLANATADTLFPLINDQLAKLFEDRNVILTDGGIITWTGAQIQFTQNLHIQFNSKVAGGTPVSINLGSANVPLANGDIWYAIVDRVGGTATLSTAATLPAVVAANQEVFLIAKRVDDADTTARLYWRSGASLNPGQVARVGTNTDVSLAAIGAVPNANGASISANQVLTLQPANASFGGVVTAIAQSFAGTKTFLGDIIASTLVQINGATSGNIKLLASAITTTYSFVFPPNAGAAGQVLSTNGAGVTSWVTPSGATAFWDAVVGSPAQVAAGVATHSGATALQDACNAAGSNGTVYILKGAGFTGNLTLSFSPSIIQGQGWGSTIGAVTLNPAADAVTFKNVRFTDNMVIGAGSTQHIITDFFLDSGHIITDNNASGVNYIKGMGL